MKIFKYLTCLLIPASVNLAQLPPIIDRELFFGDPEISAAQISPDGKWISFVKPYNEVQNIWIKGIQEGFENARPLTNDSVRPITAYFWSRNSKYIIYAQDKGGDENYRIYVVNPLEQGDPVPTSRDLTPLANIRAMIYDIPKQTPNEIIVGLNDRRVDLHDVYRVNVETGVRTLLRKNDENIISWDIDPSGNVRLGTRQTADGGMELLLVDGENLTPIYVTTSQESFGTIRFTPDANKVYISTNKGDKIDKTQLELLDLKTLKTTLVEKDPLNEVDFSAAIFSDRTEKLLATMYVGDRVRIYFKDKEFESNFKKMKKVLPDGEVYINNWTEDETIWMVSVTSDIDPGSRYLYNTKTGKAELVYISRPELPTEYLAPMKPVRYKARDGMIIPAYLTIPKGIKAKNLPVIMFIHGGPWARDVWGYNAFAQFFANRGYAVFQPNFRGSAGFGKKFLNAGNKQWGTGSMQHDITDGVNYLINKGIADPKRVAISGMSYGGYATLAGLAFTPELYAAGFSIVGPSSIITLLNSIPPYWAPIKKIFAVRVGDVENPEELKMLEAQSPLYSAKNIKSPLYVVQGANDPRVKKAESDQIVVALRDLGRSVEYMVAPDEGHGFVGRENRLAMIVAMEKFFGKYLGGRVQEDVPENIQKKLNDITVDIKSVKILEAPKEENALGKVLKFDPSFMKSDTLYYNIKIVMREQQMSMSLKRITTKTQSDGRSVWRIVEETIGAMGEGTETIEYDAESLFPIAHHATQGNITLRFNYSESAVEGKVETQGQTVPISVKTESFVFPSSAISGSALATLPFREGFNTIINVFELRGGNIVKYNVRLARIEKVAVPKGIFDAFKVEMDPAEGEGIKYIFWYSTIDRTTVKFETILPAIVGGGTLTYELK